MTHRICRITFSANRPEYLRPTLDSMRQINWRGCELHGVFVDDMPRDRDDLAMIQLAHDHGFQEIILHDHNRGLSETWTEIWDRIRDRDYDYVWHTEDDVVLRSPVVMQDLIDILQREPGLSQVVLERQAWYAHETEPGPRDTDRAWARLRYDPVGAHGSHCVFSPMSSLYPMSRVRFDYRDFYRRNYADQLSPGGWIPLAQANLNEGWIGKALLESQGLVSAKVKDEWGQPLIQHIGEVSHGRRISPGEPFWDRFQHFDSERKYHSRSGLDWTDTV